MCLAVCGKKKVCGNLYGKSKNGFYSLVMRSPEAFTENATKSKYEHSMRTEKRLNEMDEEGFRV